MALLSELGWMVESSRTSGHLPVSARDFLGTRYCAAIAKIIRGKIDLLASLKQEVRKQELRSIRNGLWERIIEGKGYVLLFVD